MSLIPIPGVGTALGELLAAVLRVPLNRRLDRWAADIEDRLRHLESLFGLSVDELSSSEKFVTLVLHASQIAVRNHQEEKLHALRAAITNAALDPDPDFDQRLVFLRYIDELTVTHITLLRFFDEPIAVFEDRGVAWRELSTFMEGVEAAVPVLAGRREFYTLIINDLHSRRLGAPTDLTGANPDTWRTRYTRDIGREFLRFITDPLQDEEATPANGS